MGTGGQGQLGIESQGRLEPTSLRFKRALAGGFFTTSATWDTQLLN